MSRWSSAAIPVAMFASPEPFTSRRAREPVASTAPSRLAVSALDLGAERAQPLLDALVAANDLADVADRRGAVRAEARDQHRPARANIGALHSLPVQPRGPGDNRAVRVAEDDPGPHVDELVDEEEPALEHLLEDQDGALCLRGD